MRINCEGCMSPWFRKTNYGISRKEGGELSGAKRDWRKAFSDWESKLGKIWEGGKEVSWDSDFEEKLNWTHQKWERSWTSNRPLREIRATKCVFTACCAKSRCEYPTKSLEAKYKQVCERLFNLSPSKGSPAIGETNPWNWVHSYQVGNRPSPSLQALPLR